MSKQETYSVKVYCRNCFQTQSLKVKKGEYRPKEYICDNCGCKSATTSFSAQRS